MINTIATMTTTRAANGSDASRGSAGTNGATLKQEEKEQRKRHLFSLPLVWFVLMLRFGLIVLPYFLDDDMIGPMRSNRALRSILVRPSTTIGDVRETAAAMKFMSSSQQNVQSASTFVTAEECRNIGLITSTMKVLELLVFSRIAELLSPLFLGVVLLFLDLSVAWLLQEIGHWMMQQEDGDEEEILLEHVAESIRPNRTCVFPLTLSSATTSSTELSEDSEVAMESRSNSQVFSRYDLTDLSALLYLCSPVVCGVTGVYRSWESLPYLGIFLALYLTQSCRQGMARIVYAAIFLSLSAYLENFLLIMIIPCCALIRSSRDGYDVDNVAAETNNTQRRKRRVAIKLKLFVLLTAAFWSGLHFISYRLAGESHLVHHLFLLREFPVYKHPNLGTLWYFTMQVFLRFRSYFAIIFTLIPYLLVIPLSIRWYPDYPLLLATVYLSLFCLFHTHPTLLDLNVVLCIMLWSPRSLAWTGTPSLVAMCSLPVTVVLYLMDCWLWMESGNGNANYIYFQCLGYQAFVMILLLEFASASFKRIKTSQVTKKRMAQAVDIVGDAQENGDEAAIEVSGRGDDLVALGLEANDDIGSIEVLLDDLKKDKSSADPFLICNETQRIQIAKTVLPATVAYRRWIRRYSLRRDGDLFVTFLNQLEDSSNPSNSKSILLVQTASQEIFGAFVEHEWRTDQSGRWFGGLGRLFRFSNLEESVLRIHKDSKLLYQLVDATRKRLSVGTLDEMILVLEKDFTAGSLLSWTDLNANESTNDEHKQVEVEFEIVDMECYTFQHGVL